MFDPAFSHLDASGVALNEAGSSVSAAYGVSASADGSLHWDERAITSELPPSARTPATQAISGALSGDYTAATNGALDGAAAVLATAGPYGLVAAGAVELIKAWANSTPPATIDWSYGAVHGNFDPGPPFSFRRYANNVLLGVWNATIVKAHMAGTGYDYGMILASQLAAAAEQWNMTHASSAREVVSYGSVCGWGRAVEPIEVAAESLVYYSGGSCSQPWSMTVNGGPYVQPLDYSTLAISAAPPLNSSLLSVGLAKPKSSALPLLVAGGLALALLLKPALLKGILR